MCIKKLKRNDEGFASLVIALILIVVLSLLTVGFAQLARREQQSALDRQLATQANDAAESGINDALKGIDSGVITSGSGGNCLVPPGSPLWSGGPSTTVGTTGASYSCVIVDLTPNTLSKDLAAYNSWTTTFTANNVPRSFNVNWLTKNNRPVLTGNYSSYGFMPASQWNYPAVLQVSITPLINMTRDGLSNNTLTVYLYPSNSANNTSISYPFPLYSLASGNGAGSSAANGSILNGHCSVAALGFATCNSQINFSGNAGQSYLLRITDYYDDSTINFTGKDTSGNPLQFQGSQATIDVTGKARNVLKRLQAHVPLTPICNDPTGCSLEPYALEAKDICKRFSIDPYNGVSVQAPSNGQGANACSLN